MATQLRFDNVPLGYDRHPAVHHLSGEVASGALAPDEAAVLLTELE